MDNKTSWVKRADFAALCAWLIASLFMATTALLWFGQDFRSYYAAARVLLAGGNPYNFHELAPALLAATGQVGNYAYYNPPWFAWFVAPIALLPFEPARAIWMLFNWALWLLGLWQLSQFLDWPRAGWRRWLMFLLATFIFAWITWRYEQIGILLFALLMGALTALRNRNWIGAGFWLALLLVKPNVTLIPVATIALWLIRRRQWQPVAIMCILTIGLLIGATIATPDWYMALLKPDFGQGLTTVLDGPEQMVGSRINTTLNDWLKMFQIGSEIRSVLYASLSVIGVAILALMIWRSQSLIHVTIASLLVGFALTPYALQYDYPPLTLVLFWATSLCTRTTSTKAVGIAINLFIASVLFWERPISDGYWIVIGLIGLTLWSWWTSDKQHLSPVDD